MNSVQPHKVLLVSNDRQTAGTIGKLLEKQQIPMEKAKTTVAGLEELKAASPFSLVIADQDMDGTLFLEQAKKISPDTIRFLISGDAQIQTTINAVNKGAVQNYISKPLDQEKMAVSIGYGLKLFQRHIDHHRLFALAKKQNTKLYELNCELMETAKSHEKKLHELGEEIQTVTKRIEESVPPPQMDRDRAMDALKTYVFALEGEKDDRASLVYTKTITRLYEQLNDLALRNGIELPEPWGTDA